MALPKQLQPSHATRSCHTTLVFCLQLCKTADSTGLLPLALPVLDAKAAPLEAAVRPRPIPAVAHVDPVLSAALSITRPVLTAPTASIASTALEGPLSCLMGEPPACAGGSRCSDYRPTVVCTRVCVRRLVHVDHVLSAAPSITRPVLTAPTASIASTALEGGTSCLWGRLEGAHLWASLGIYAVRGRLALRRQCVCRTGLAISIEAERCRGPFVRGSWVALTLVKALAVGVPVGTDPFEQLAGSSAVLLWLWFLRFCGYVVVRGLVPCV